MRILISPCLIGICTRWDGSCEEIEELTDLVKSGQAVFMCPEQIGGMSTPSTTTVLYKMALLADNGGNTTPLEG
jgi:uncharacterized protein YbbK (DUF523 family)